MTIDNLLQAATITLTTITSVAALAVVLFGSAAWLERWLDRPHADTTSTRDQLTLLTRVAPQPLLDQEADSDVA
jgi:hypothetical protein